MDRRTFIGCSALITAGCGASDMPQEYLLQPSPARKGSQLNAGVSGFEEGFWTPSLGGNTTYNLQIGYYTRIGGIVFITCSLDILTIGTGNPLAISGLPYLSKKGISQVIPVSGAFNIATAIVEIKGRLVTQSNAMSFLTKTTAAGTENAADPIFQDGTILNATGVYRIDV